MGVFEVDSTSYPEWVAQMKLQDPPAFGRCIPALNICPPAIPKKKREEEITTDLRKKIPKKNTPTCPDQNTIELKQIVKEMQKQMDVVKYQLKQSNDYITKIQTTIEEQETQLHHLSTLISKEE